MDGFAELGVFTRVVDTHSFTRAARTLGITPSGVSRVITRLEQRLGIRLLQRTTRSLSLTDEGAAYYERCKKILVELEDAESSLARSTTEPHGRLRVDAPTVLGPYFAPKLPELLSRYPELSIELSMRDNLIDPTAEGVDITLRMAPLRDSELVSRSLGGLRLVVVGSPKYFAKHGRPKHPDELIDHAMIGFLLDGAPMPWQFRGDRSVVVDSQLTTNSHESIREAALAGLGLARLFEFWLADDVERGRLEAVLVDYEAPPRPVYALYARHRATTPKLRVFLEWAEQLIAARRKR
jgi:DNA-binding transcriptional LysR family regulator